MGVETVSIIVAAFVSGSLGIAALMRNFRSRLCICFAALSGILFCNHALSILESFDSVWRYASPKLHVICLLGLGAMMLLLLREILPIYQKRLLRLVRWGYVPIMILCSLFMTTRWYAPLSIWLLFFSHLLIILPVAIWMVALDRAQRVHKLTRERLRLRYVFWGGAITIGFFITDALHFSGVRVAPLGTLAAVLYLIFIFQTFIQKELMTSEEVVAKIALFGGVALVLSIIYSLLVSWVGNRSGLFFFNTFIASFVIIVLFDPIRKATTLFTRKLFLRRNSMLEEQLNWLSLDLMGIVEPLEISRKIAAALKKSLGVEASSLFLLDRDGLSYIPVEPSVQAIVAELSSSNPLVEYMSLRRGRPFVLETIENDRDSFHSFQQRRFCQTCLDALRDLGADFVIPFLHEAKVVGFYIATTGERIALSNEQLRLFIPVSRQIALLLKNAQTFTILRDRDKLAAVGEMAAGLAHEIKNPLGAIKGAAQLLNEGIRENSQNTQEFMKIILEETDRLSSVLTGFLDYAKPRRNYPQPSCDPLHVIEHTASMILRDSKVNFEIQSEKAGLTIEADPEILKQVLLNLFINAIQAMEKFSPNPELKVKVREIRPRKLFSFAESLPIYKVWEGWEAQKPASPHAFIEIAIEDNGIGIQAEDIPRIFAPFFTTKPKGTGLGLAICQRLVEGMGGTIHVRSNTPTGSVFVIHLPIRREEGKELADLQSTKQRSRELAV